ncbi:MAG TPA: nuclear transport factor 2 family protein [Micromonosporaceae bacterium]|jgi:ketosteroid isomerase-like protein
MIPSRVAGHCERFNAAIRAGDFTAFVQTFTNDAVMRFHGVPAGPYRGRDEIAAAYARRPPTDTMIIRSVRTEGDTDVVRFAWDSGGSGTMTVRWRDGMVADVAVAFD